MKDAIIDTLFQAIFDHPSIGAAILDHDKNFVRVNECCCNMLGYSEEELIGKNPIELTFYEDLERTRSFHENVLNPSVKGGSYEKRLRKKDGTVLWVKIIAKTLKHPKDEQQIFTLALIEDITFQREFNAQAEFNQIQLNAILETAVLGVWCVDSNWKVTYCNSAIQKILGYSEAELLTKNLREITHPQDIQDTNLKLDQLKPGGKYQAIRRYLKGDNTYVTTRISVSKFIGSNKNLYGLALVEDITAQLEAEKKIKAREAMMIASSKMAALGDMANGVAHEINNPLFVIVGKIHQAKKMLENEPPDINKVLKELETANKNADRISNIVKGLLNFSRDAEHDPMVPFPLKLIFENLEFLCHERFKSKGILLEIEEKVDPKVLILGRETQIVQALLNVVMNAFDAVETLSEKWVHVSSIVDQFIVQLVVIDSGKGIPDDVAKNLMIPFFSTKPTGKGTGLGLSIAHGIIEDHKGKIYYDKNFPNTRFVIELPRYQQTNRV